MSRKFKEVGLNGLPLPSTLREKHRNKLGYDRQDNLKILKGVNLTWQNLDKRDVNRLLKPLSNNKIIRYNMDLKNSLTSDYAIRSILWQALKDVQPSKTNFL